MTAWAPSGVQYPALVVLAALVLLGVTVVVSAWADARADRRRDTELAERYRRGPGTVR